MAKKWDVPPLWTLGLAVAAVALARWLPVGRFDQPFWGWLGLLVMADGVAIVIWCAAWFRRVKTTIDPRGAPTTLIVEGPYRISRNPIYSGMALFLLGWGLWLGAVSALLVPFVFAAIITNRFIRHEEANLKTAFGTGANHYFATTNRWLPVLTKL